MSRARGPRRGIVVKLGGSVITDKRGDRPRIRRQVLDRLARELAAAPRGRLIAVVHGAGSFGHGPVQRSGIHRGVRTPSQRLAWAEVQVLQNELNAAVCRALQAAGLPAVPCQASAAAVLDHRVLGELYDRALRLQVARGMVPVLYGVPAADTQQGCAILSGDVLAPELADRLRAGLLLLGTDVDGVYSADPNRDETARHFDRITRKNWPAVRDALTGSTSADVTGGMYGKVSSLLQRARRGLEIRILDATRPGHLAAALRGAPLGTRIG